MAEEGDIEVRMDLEDGVLRVEVLDPGPGFTSSRARTARRATAAGGCVFTDRVAIRWADRGGPSVWFELDGS